MRFDKLTTKFQQALRRRPEHGARQRQRLHRAAAPPAGAAQPGGRRHGVAPVARRRRRAARSRPRSSKSIARLPKVEGQGGEISISRDLNNLLNLTDKEAAKRGDQFIASELFLLALDRRQGRDRPAAEGARAERKALEAAIEAVRGGADDRLAGSRRAARGAEEVHHRPHRARPRGQARPGDRSRRRDPPHHPDPAATHQEQPGADRRARRRQDRHRRGPRPAHRQRRSARDAQEQARAVARHGGAARRRQVPRRVRGAPEGRAEGHRRRRGPHDRVHRRAAHHGRAPARRRARSMPATC